MLTYKAENGNYYMSYVATKEDWQRIGKIEALAKELGINVLELLEQIKQERKGQ